ncbi:sigma-70 family RNA polymerase sigma factor [Paenibacillus sp. FSL H7-0756]|uniref:RNA polymerase sigma factor n=1 Tax=Paenibacillus sp. FSL H7-0756 TaxID=2954738 RepID=UPI0030FB9AFF
MDEVEWIRRIQEGETQYLTPLIEHYYPGIQKYCYYRVRSEEEAKDLTQETFYRFCRSIDKYRHTGKCLAYLYTIARNLCKDYLQKRRSLSWEQVQEAEKVHIRQTPSIEEQVEGEQLVTELLLILPEEQREMVFMRYCLDMTFRDISRVTGVNVCMVQYRVNRGLVVFRNYLERSGFVEQEAAAFHRNYTKRLPFVSR